MKEEVVVEKQNKKLTSMIYSDTLLKVADEHFNLE